MFNDDFVGMSMRLVVKIVFLAFRSNSTETAKDCLDAYPTFVLRKQASMSVPLRASFFPQLWCQSLLTSSVASCVNFNGLFVALRTPPPHPRYVLHKWGEVSTCALGMGGCLSSLRCFEPQHSPALPLCSHNPFFFFPMIAL